MSNKKEVSTDEQVPGQLRKWAGLNPEILALIFVRIDPVDEMVRSVPFVCKSWMEVVGGPYCWSKVDVQAWCRRRNDSDAVDLVVKKLVRRSKCSVQRLSTYRIGESGFFFIAHCGRFLKELEIPMSGITDQMVSKHIKPLPNLTLLDISYCYNITSKGIAAFGNQCHSLVHLKRNMPPIEDNLPFDDSEAITIASTMPHLQHIELCCGQFGDSGLFEMLHKCKSLTHLDILKCWNVELNGDLAEICERLQHFQSPWDEFSDDTENSEAAENDIDESD
uniref:F-box protein FBW2-like n=1 Tax=Erigeron canadensis TaxID=72917 RepID=UPI001CB9B62D|nr:F-box protein FBW2-like [Erigeron canadensis]